jgi:hypothetical protein
LQYFEIQSKKNSQEFECPRCRQGFIEEVTEGFRPEAPVPSPTINISPRSPYFNFLFYENETDLDPATEEAPPRRARRLPLRTQLAPTPRRRARSRSPHVSLLVESNSGNANFRIGLGLNARATANRFLSVAIDDIMDSFFAPEVHTRPPAMTEEQLQEIAKASISEEQVRNELMCSVCFDDFKTNESEIRKLQCEHFFHEKCIFPWLRTNASCPVCRTKLSNAAPSPDNDDEDIGK